MDDAIAAQIGAVWENLLATMTAQGATRDDLIQVSAQTAGQILGLTANALWPQGQVPTDEVPDMGAFADARRILDSL